MFKEDNIEIEKDTNGKVRAVSHFLNGYLGTSAGLVSQTPRELAEEYLKKQGYLIDIPEEKMENFSGQINDLVFSNEGEELRFIKEKATVDVASIKYSQTLYNIPVWNAGVTVVLGLNPVQVTGMQNECHYELNIANPDMASPYMPNNIDNKKFKQILATANICKEATLNKKKLWIFYFDADERFENHEDDTNDLQSPMPTLDFPKISDVIESGKHYVVTEILFSFDHDDFGHLNWQAIVEVNTGSILRVRALTACCTGLVYDIDPTTKGHNVTPNSSVSALDDLRVNVELRGLLQTPINEQRELVSEFVKIVDNDSPSNPIPKQYFPYKFDYSTSSKSFAAVNAYYHCDEIFRMIDSMGINVQNYFEGTSFPVPVDPWAMDGQINAQAPGNMFGNGSGGFLFGRAGTNLGMAAVRRVVMHEFGHALLWNHVDNPNFGFAHSAGDALAAILYDPESKANDRYLTFPFMNIDRRHDRDVNSGWAWRGSRHNRQYKGEQILSTTLFRVYRAFGGDSDNLSIRSFASRYVSYLTIKAISLLNYMTSNPGVYVNALMQTDINTSNFEGIPGGSLYKVIRWSFEKQGLYHKPTARDLDSPGEPPNVDIYIDDGRKGEYMPYLKDISANKDIWNRHEADGKEQHQKPTLGEENYLYIKLKNRGLKKAENIVVKAYQSQISSNNTWPSNWLPLLTPEIKINQKLSPEGEMIIGPFKWAPQLENPQILIAASANNDTSNTEFIRQSINLDYLIRADNNTAMRSM